jgi:hypothetical protein
MTKLLPSPWRALQDGPAFVHPLDEKYVAAFNKNANAKVKLRTALVPEPAFGRTDAPVVLLLLNPGVGKSDSSWHSDPAYRTSLLKAVRSPRPREHFHLLGPPEAPGTKWWRSACKVLLQTIDEKQLARKILSVEFSPYHSAAFAHGHMRLPTQAYGFELVRAAVERGAHIVCMRGERHWKGAVPELVGYGLFRKLRNPRSSALSPKNVPKFSSLLQRLRDDA